MQCQVKCMPVAYRHTLTLQETLVYWMQMNQPTDHNPQLPGERIRQLLIERGWTQDDLAQILDRPRPTVVNIINGKKSITPETAIALAAAFGTTADYWMGLETQYRLALAATDSSGVEHRRHLYDVAPIKEMERRGWIKPTNSAEELERELCQFFGVESLEHEPQITVATKRPSSNEPLTAAQRAWCFRARQLARIVYAEKFNPDLLPHCEKRLRELAAFPDEARNVPKVLAGYGIRFVVIEPLASNRIDGAAFWLSADEPVIALSVRFDRIDAFWFALGHEFAHIKNGDASVDAELVGESATPSEGKTDIERAPMSKRPICSYRPTSCNHLSCASVRFIQNRESTNLRI